MFYNFNPHLQEPFNVIHPLQINAIQKLLMKDIPKSVKRIYLFGGSLELSCGIYSDIDIYVISGENPNHVYRQMHGLCKGFGKLFDILVSDIDAFVESANELGTVERDIVDKGVCIYADI